MLQLWQRQAAIASAFYEISMMFAAALIACAA
jgi:hypothetical protein